MTHEVEIIDIGNEDEKIKHGQEEIDRDPFKNLKIDDHDILNAIKERSPCIKCAKSRRYYCYTCYVPVNDLLGRLPRVKVPIQIDIIKHRREIDGKSTAAHAALLAPDFVNIYTYPNIPNYENYKEILLIYPTSTAIGVDELLNKNVQRLEEKHEKGFNVTTLLKKRIFLVSKSEENDMIEHVTMDDVPYKRIVCIDSTWNQSNGIYKDARLNRLKCIVLQKRASQFWRHQKNSPRWYLATIEAIHQFCVEIHVLIWGYKRQYEGALRHMFYDFDRFQQQHKVSESDQAYCGQYDNLLYFFKFMHDKIHKFHDHQELKAYQRPLR